MINIYQLPTGEYQFQKLQPRWGDIYENGDFS